MYLCFRTHACLCESRRTRLSIHACICASVSAPPNFEVPLLCGGRTPRLPRRLRPGERAALFLPGVPAATGRGSHPSGARCPSCGGGDDEDGIPGPVPHLLPRAGVAQPCRSPSRSGHPATVLGAEAGPGKPRRERLSSVGRGSRCKKVVRGSRGERRDRRHGRPASLWVSCEYPPIWQKRFGLKKKKKKFRSVCPRGAARAASRTRNLLIFPTNISELYNGI